MMENKLQDVDKDLNTLQQSFSRYHNRLFSQCKFLASQVAAKEELSPLTEWVAENNILASEFQLMKLQENSEECRKLQVKFQRQLKKIQSLLVSTERAELELCVLYNCLQSSPEETASHCLSSVILDSFTRMQTGENSLKGVQGFPDVLEKMSRDLKTLAGVRNICLLWAAGLVRSGELEKAHLVLTSLQALPTGTSRHTNMGPVEFAVKMHQGSPPLTDEDTEALVYILLASCYLVKDSVEECTEIIAKVKVSRFKSISVYIKALSLYKEQCYTDAVTALQSLSPADVKNSEVCLRARIHCVTGCCLSKLGKPHTALHHLKAALEADFSCTVALYYIAEQYKQLGMESAELETLNLLITTLENSSSAPKPCNMPLAEQVSSAVLRMLGLPYTVTVIQVQYLLAARCLQLHRFETAYQRYMDLLAIVMKSDVIQCEGKLIKVPRLHQIFLEAIKSSLRCRKLEACVTLCDQALLSGPVGITSDHIPRPADTNSSDHKAGKRKRVASSQEISEEESSASHITACLLHKAEALQLLGELEEAALTLHSAADQLEKRLSGINEERTKEDSDCEPPMKRARVSPDSGEPGHPETPCVTLSQVYERLGKVSSQQGKHSKAVHYYRLSLLLLKGNQTTVYHLTQELFLLNRFQEAVSIWLESREIIPKMDSFQLNREIQAREMKLKNMTAELSDSPPNERELMVMDVKVMKVLLCHRQNHVWQVS